MKYNVLHVFRDKNTNDIHKTGDVVEYTKKRATEINKTMMQNHGIQALEEVANDDD